MNLQTNLGPQSLCKQSLDDTCKNDNPNVIFDVSVSVTRESVEQIDAIENIIRTDQNCLDVTNKSEDTIVSKTSPAFDNHSGSLDENEMVLKKEMDETEVFPNEKDVTEIKVEVEFCEETQAIHSYLGIQPNDSSDSRIKLPKGNIPEDFHSFDSFSTQHYGHDILRATDVPIYKDKNKITYRCIECSAILKSMNSYNNHISKHRKKERKELIKNKRLETMKRRKESQGCDSIKCDECGKIYTFKASLESHMKSHKPVITKTEPEEYPCMCGRVYSRKSRMETCFKAHNEVMHKAVFPKCPRCKQYFNDEGDLANHRKLAHWPKRYLCKFCPMEYQVPNELLHHLEVHRNYQIKEYALINDLVHGKQDLKCIICNKVPTDMSDLKSHILEEHKESFSCMKCNETFEKIKDFISHMKDSHGEMENLSVVEFLEAFIMLMSTLKCEPCNVHYDIADDMAKHYIQHRYMNAVKLEQQEGNRIPESQYQCKDCKRFFISSIKLQRHRLRNHDIFGPYSEMTSLSDISLICLHCKKQCENKVDYDRHSKLHSSDSKFACDYCCFRFSTLKRKKAHETIHTGDEKYICFICNFKCDTASNWNLHNSTDRHKDMKESLLVGTFFHPKPVTEVILKQEVIDDDEDDDDCDETQNEEQYNGGEDQSINDGSVQVCDICKQSFQNMKDLVDHKKTHPFITIVGEGNTSIFFK